MAVRWIAAAWETDLKSRVIPTERVYIDFRQIIYPPFNHDLTYTLIASGDNQPGSHNLTGGNAYYLLELPSTLTVRARVKPTFSWNTASDQPIWSWYLDANNYLTLYYDATNDRYQLKWKDGGVEAVLQSDQYVDDITLQVWTDIDCSIDLTTGTTAGSALYIDRVSKDTVWSGNIDAKGMNYQLFEIRSENATEGAYTINHVRMFLNDVATSDEISDDYKDVKNEEIIWHFNGEGCGRTRCNVTRFMQNLATEKSVEDFDTGATGTNTCTVSLWSTGGEFADDQYAAFDPTLDQFNGTSAQKYMQHRCRLEAETWYSNDYELIFTGRCDEGSFARDSGTGILQTVSITAEDMISDIARKFRDKGISYENKLISDATEANSLVHLIARLATKDDIYNYLSNSSFENATIANSWTVAGTGATFSRVAGGIFGSFQGDLVYGSATCSASQTVTFTDTKKLNVGETWTFSVYLKSASACSYTIKLAENDSVGENANSTTTYTITGGEGWSKWEVSHTVTDGDSDRLIAYVELDDNVTLSIDGAMLTQTDRAMNWFILNDNDGASGVESADDADSDSFNIMGFDVDAVNITHPWVLITAGKSIWEELQTLGDATTAMYNGIDEAGTYKFRSKLKTGYADPSSLETIDDAEIIDVSTEREEGQANKLVVRGIKIVKSANNEYVWSASATEQFGKDGKRWINETVANGSYWPDPATYGEFWAEYKKG